MNILRRSLLIVFLFALTSLLVITVGCVRQSGSVWYFHEASTPDGWPQLTPVNSIEVKTYPAYREAVVTADEAAVNETGGSQNDMFRQLFKHIQKNDISMTAPVDMTYQASDEKPQLRSMAFLYDVPQRGELDEKGPIVVRDVPARQVVSIGVRGRYSDEHFDEASKQLQNWIMRQDEYQTTGPPRYLGYNSPFVPFFWRYGEVQIPVKPVQK